MTNVHRFQTARLATLAPSMLLACCGLVACNSPTPATSDSGSPGNDGGAQPDTGSGPHSGTLQVSQYAIAGVGTPMASFNALFGDFDLTDLQTLQLPGCTSMTSGPCVAVHCSGSPPSLASAGTITVTVDGAAGATAMPSANGTYNATIASGITAGQSIDVSAAGATVPAFSASVTVPAAPTSTLPATIPTSADLTITWTGVTTPTAGVSIAPNGGPTTRGLLTCVVPGAGGTITIPSAMLAEVGVGAAFVGVSSIAETTQTAGDYALSTRAILGVGAVTMLQ